MARVTGPQSRTYAPFGGVPPAVLPWRVAPPAGAARSLRAPTSARNIGLTATAGRHLIESPRLCGFRADPEALLGGRPQLHTVAMKCLPQGPALFQEGKHPIHAHRPLQIEAKDVRQVYVCRQGP